MEFIKYKKIKHLGDDENKHIFDIDTDEIVVQEKVDGANFRFYITKYNEIIFGSRGREIENINDNMNKAFYDWENTPKFLGFDILDSKTNEFLESKKVNVIYKLLDLDIVPIIEITTAKEIKKIKIEDSFVPKSKFYDGLAEGLVFKNHKRQTYAKYVRAQFKEMNRDAFGGSKKYAKSDDEYFTLKYCTNGRIEKAIWKLLDDGNKLELSLMPKLIGYVFEDIFEENLKDIIYSRKTINTKNLKLLVTKRCFTVLSNVITNNYLHKGERKIE